MATDPAQRYRTPRALADDVEHWLADEPVSAWREPLVRRLRRWGRRHRLVVTGLAATLLVAVAALAVGNLLVARQRNIAERNLAFARTVVDEMYTGVADKLEDQKQMDDYQREILEKALAFYERFALPQSRDPQVRLEAGRAGLRVGTIRLQSGKYRSGRASLSPGIPSPERTGVRLIRPSRIYRDALAQAHRRLSILFHEQEYWSEAEREIKEAVLLWSALRRRSPRSAEYRSKLADAHSRLCDIYTHQKRYKEAEEELRQALDASEPLARQYPDVTAYQQSLASILADGLVLRSMQNDLARAAGDGRSGLWRSRRNSDGITPK